MGDVDRSTFLDVRHDGGVAHVYLNRPRRRNAFNATAVAELTAVFDELAQRAGLRAVVLGAHGKTFCAGADLAWMQSMAEASFADDQADAQRLADMLWTVYRCPVPVIGRIQGDCFAGGMGLAAACDVRVASEGARFCLSEVRLGLAPCTIAPYVIRALGEQATRRYAVTGERFDAARAQSLAFVHEVCPADAIDATVDALVAAVLANGPRATRACKQLVHDVAGRALDDALRAETARRIAELRSSDEGRAGVHAFLHKQPMPWLAMSEGE